MLEQTGSLTDRLGTLERTKLISRTAPAQPDIQLEALRLPVTATSGQSDSSRTATIAVRPRVPMPTRRRWLGPENILNSDRDLLALKATLVMKVNELTARGRTRGPHGRRCRDGPGPAEPGQRPPLRRRKIRPSARRREKVLARYQTLCEQFASLRDHSIRRVQTAFNRVEGNRKEAARVLQASIGEFEKIELPLLE